MPKLGLVMKEGLVVLWHAQEGDRTFAGKLLLEIESDKVTTEIEAPASGVLRKIIVGADEIVPCGTVEARRSRKHDDHRYGCLKILRPAPFISLTDLVKT